MGPTSFEHWLDTQPQVLAAQPQVLTSLAAAEQVCDQDIVTSERGPPTLRDGVARDRRSSLEDSQMRHGRKSGSTLIDGYKRHVLRDLDSGLVVAVGITPANVPEATVTDSIALDLHAQGLRLRELHIDRAYLEGRAKHKIEVAGRHSFHNRRRLTLASDTSFSIGVAPSLCGSNCRRLLSASRRQFSHSRRTVVSDMR